MALYICKMAQTRILAFSSSRVGNGGYLESAAPVIREFLGNGPSKVAFVGFAGVDLSYESYAAKVQDALPFVQVFTVEPDNAAATIGACDAIMVGGGNTFKLLAELYSSGAIQLIREKVLAGTPYIGWSAGSNITGLTICTTNDMPIVQPESFRALGFFPFQINPHYINIQMEGHNGETRDQRLTEFMLVNPGVEIVCLPEGTVLQYENDVLMFNGIAGGVLFTRDAMDGHVQKLPLPADTDISRLMQQPE